METAPYLTVRQAADVVGVHHKTIRKWIANGTLAAVRFSPRTTRILLSDLALVGRAAAPTAAQPYDVPLPIDDAEQARLDYLNGEML